MFLILFRAMKWQFPMHNVRPCLKKVQEAYQDLTCWIALVDMIGRLLITEL